MKILVTGMNKNQCTENFYLQQQLQVIPSHPSLLACLRDMGHTVEQRPVLVGEDLSSYDRVIVYLHNPTAFSGYVYGALWAITSHYNVVTAYDDWQIDSIYGGLVRLLKDGNIFNDYLFNQHSNLPDDIRTYDHTLLKAVEEIRDKKHPLLISAFAGGNTSLLYDHPDIITYNPNPYHIHRVGSTVFDKIKCFNFASLVQGKTAKWLKKQNIKEWNIKYYGSRKDGQDRLTEAAMCNVYASHWGCLMPGYFHAGSGWWRARPTQVADVGSILIGDPAEMMVLYGDKQLAHLTAHDLEICSIERLHEIAAAQHDALYKLHPLDKDVQQTELRKILT